MPGFLARADSPAGEPGASSHDGSSATGPFTRETGGSTAMEFVDGPRRVEQAVHSWSDTIVVRRLAGNAREQREGSSLPIPGIPAAAARHGCARIARAPSRGPQPRPPRLVSHRWYDRLRLTRAWPLPSAK